MLSKAFSYFALPLLLLLSSSSGNSAPQSSAKSQTGPTGTRERMIVASGRVTMNLDLNRLRGNDSAAGESKLDTLRFEVSPNSFFTFLLFNGDLRGAEPGAMELIWGNSAVLPEPLNASSSQLVLERMPAGGPFELIVRDGKTGFVFFNIEGHLYDWEAAAHSLRINGGRLLVSEELANKLERPAEAGVVIGEIAIAASVYPIEVTTVVNGAAQSTTLPPRGGSPEGGNVPGPDIIVGDMPGLAQFGSATNQVGLGVGTTSCNNGSVPVHFYQLPDPDHSVFTQNLYRMSGGTTNNDRFEQIGQAWIKHTFGANQDNACAFGCTPFANNTELGVGCSDPYLASQNATQGDHVGALGSRAWVNPFTGFFPVSPRPENHAGHTHTGTSHRILVNATDLNTTLNAGATYYCEVQYDSPQEYAWCQAHPGECNMYNNASYKRYNVTGTTSFTFSAVGSAIRMTPATGAWTGATSATVEPAPGVDGRAFVVYKVTGPIAGIWHYEYAVHNQNLDRSIQSFSVPLGCGITLSNIGFHAPPNHPGFPNDGTVGNTGFSNAAWTATQTVDSMSWNTETLAQNPNANAIRYGTMYNFRFDSDRPPAAVNATVGFFKAGTPITVGIQGPSPDVCTGATPTPTPPPTPTPSATVIPTPSPTSTPTAPTPTPPVTPTPSTTPCGNIIFAENFDGVTAPALPPGWSTGGSGNGILWVTSTIEPDTAPNCAFIDDQASPSDKYLTSPLIVITSAAAQLSFRNYFNTEFIPPPNLIFYDGGVLEVSINGGTFNDVTDPAVGGSFVTGGYTGELEGSGLNPLGGRMAWSGDSGGYINTVINLGPNLNGQSIRLRFRMGTDLVVGAPGWRVDTISITGCPGPSPTPTPPNTPSPTPTATVPTSTPTPTPFFVRILWEGFDAVTAPALPPGWVPSSTSGPANCTPTGTCALGTQWTTHAGVSQTAPNAAFHNDPGCVTDSNLDTPSIFVPMSDFPPFIEFWHSFDLEAGHDGGVLEISIDGGAFMDIEAAGGAADYNGTISMGFLSPIAGRQAWTGNSGGFVSGFVSLPAAARGHNVVLRFRLATDCSGAGVGWYIDSISIAYYVSDASPTPPQPTPVPATPTPTPTISPPATATPTATGTPIPPTQAINLSTRMRVQTGANVGIGGFIITGTAPKHVLLRAIGPSLTQLGVPDALADPVLELHGPGSFTTIINNNWRDDPAQEAAIIATGIAPTNNLESAIDATLAPGAYTAIVRGNGNTLGVALFEIYDLSPAPGSKLGNISTRAFVDTGNNIVIAGFIVGGSPPQADDKIIVRGIGPSLTALGVPDALADPKLDLRDGNGALMIANNDWQDDPTGITVLELVSAGLAPTNSLESGIVAVLPPGLYTALLSGMNNGTGVGLVEVYDRGLP